MSRASRVKIAGRSVGEWVLASEALLLLAAFRVALALVPARRILQIVAGGADPMGEAPSEQDRAIVVRVRWAVEAAVRHSAVRFVCFPQTLAGYVMLRRRGVRGTMVYGVARSTTGKLIAHTWLMLGERCVLGGAASEEFTAVERWG